MDATPPRRSWLARLKPKVTLPLMLGLLLLATPFAVRRLQLAGLPDIGDPFDIEEFSNINISDDENAFVEYAEAAALLVPLAAGDEFDLNEVVAAGWSSAPPGVRQWLTANRSQLDLWRQGTEKPKALYKRPAKQRFDTLLPVTHVLRDFARLALLEASRLHEQGDMQAAWEWYRAVFRSSRHSGQRAAMIERVVGVAMHRMVCEPLEQWSRDPRVSQAQLRSALTALANDYKAMTAPRSDAIRCNYCTNRNMCTRDELLRIGNLRDQHPTSPLPSEFIPIVMYVRNEAEVCRRIGQHAFANLLLQIDRPRYARMPWHSGTLALFEPDPSLPTHPQQLTPAELETVLARSDWAKLLLTDAASFDTAVAREQARQAALELVLACQIFQRMHGDVPEAAELLVGDVLDALPQDPFGKSGDTLRYRRDADRFLVWSVGEDGSDDGGQLIDNGLPVYIDPIRSGDYGFAVPLGSGSETR